MAKKPARPLLVRVGIAFLVAFLAAIPSGYAFLEWTVQPSFCTTCHLMIPYYKSWEDSSHGKAGVACIECHYEPGVIETARGKVMALNMVVKYFTGAEGTKPWAEVSDASCMRGGCHSTRLLAGEVKFQPDPGREVSIPFNHTPHLLEMRGSKKLRCTSCHSQIVQGEHLTVTTTTCFLCHFKGARQDPKLSDCNTCHGPPSQPIDLGGFVFEHRDYLDRGVDCESCHRGMTQGSGEVPKHRCSSCHGVVEHLERYGETEFIHRTHVTDHKVECLQCHTEITHKLRGRPGLPDPDSAPAAPLSGAANCDACHSSRHEVSQSFYRGSGGRGVPDDDGHASAMWLARVDCSGCHRRLPGTATVASGVAPASEVACLSCHGPGFEGMMGRWQAAYGEATEAVGAEVDAALRAAREAGAGADLLRGLGDAAHDVALVRADGSRGVHNPWYARSLLEAAHVKAAEARHALDPGGEFPAFRLGTPFATNMTCAMLCHIGIEKQDVRREGTRFVHAKHLGKGFDCDACHTRGLPGRPGEPHGGVRPDAVHCLPCHHGAKPPNPASSRTCASCHSEADRFLRGIRADGTEGESMMAEVSCDACHGDPPALPVVETVKPNCVACHDGEEKYASTLHDWLADARDWRAAAEARLAKVRRAAAAKGGAAAEALARAEAILLRLRFAVPVHNILLFEEEKEAFDEAASAAEKALR